MRPLITEKDIKHFLKTGQTKLAVRKNTLITPLALDLIKSENIIVSEYVDHKCLVRNLFVFAKPKFVSNPNEYYSLISNTIIPENTTVNKEQNQLNVIKKVSLNREAFGIILSDKADKWVIIANKFPNVYCVKCSGLLEAEELSQDIYFNLLVIPANLLSDLEMKKSLYKVLKNSNGLKDLIIDQEIKSIEKSFVKKVR